MTDNPDLVALLLEKDYSLRPRAELTSGLTASRAQVVERLLHLPYSAHPELDTYFQPEE
ncbi:MAG: hypothetical protein LUC93_17990 [Planctomycetaceae bacterium]|nr:hypothetical protein [Planctomycetaceae bacterium]